MTPQICVDNTFELQHRVTILSHTQDGCYKFIWNRNLLLFFFLSSSYWDLSSSES